MPSDQDTHSSPGALPDAPASTTKQPCHSFKKKFAKLKVKFELEMRESEALVREQLRIEDVSKKLQETNDQLLEVLMEFNESLYIPTNLRYDLSVPGEATPPLTPDDDDDIAPSTYTPTAAKAALKEARAELDAGEITADTYRRLERGIKRSTTFRPSMQYASLRQIAQHGASLVASSNSIFPELDQDKTALLNMNYMTPEHEHEYLLALDAKMGNIAAEAQLKQLPDKPTFADREREAILQNPNSVYNWLRRNTPYVFLQDNEVASEKSSQPQTQPQRSAANARSSKRSSLATSRQPAKEEDMYDEDGIALEVPAPSASKAKRKRDEDTGYRPKGGRSGSNKKKKQETDSSHSGRRASKRGSGVGA
ncbi:conserved hypothetical protein [Talaromyces stipitatus ATCC 10500]|uniref:IEC3 subunit of the Ino80 complex, chromatin re-modelling-domain-containing protein n=1 Tax=Talaromyces stipitatus (strain ATCC 10500 / CBS 375.48 / QM 6759 / NRRL 1006) TaxID=441959 RepID=B8MNL9_TALSN|nr:uncharacterized protein TSTA_103320 [Talaromyces stipitatus ATCC 10500]EED14108.1 conserved hypothetical protein [Talaromyces stipitatus ATCC 10500]